MAWKPAHEIEAGILAWYFTSRAAMEQSLVAFLRFYNTQRLHSGYRLRGQTPVARSWGGAAKAA